MSKKIGKNSANFGIICLDFKVNLVYNIRASLFFNYQ